MQHYHFVLLLKQTRILHEKESSIDNKNLCSDFKHKVNPIILRFIWCKFFIRKRFRENEKFLETAMYDENYQELS